MKTTLAALFCAFIVSPVAAASVLLIDGATSSTEPTTQTDITGHVTTLHSSAGHSVTVSDGIPADLSPFDQVWDLRFSNTAALSTDDQTHFIDYLANGGTMVLLGENDVFADRNASLIGLVETAGGGKLHFEQSRRFQTTGVRFGNQFVALTAPGGVKAPRKGHFIAEDAFGSGVGVAWEVGDLNQAREGALAVVFDVNFVQSDANSGELALSNSLIKFLAVQSQVDLASIPLPAGGVLIISGLAGFAVLRRRRRTA